MQGNMTAAIINVMNKKLLIYIRWGNLRWGNEKDSLKEVVFELGMEILQGLWCWVVLPHWEDIFEKGCLLASPVA